MDCAVGTARCGLVSTMGSSSVDNVELLLAYVAQLENPTDLELELATTLEALYVPGPTADPVQLALEFEPTEAEVARFVPDP